jgi:hypothetical protein
MYEHAYGPVPKGLIVAHTCDIGVCVRLHHLEAITRQQNIRDAFRRKRYKRGRYNDDDVRALREGEIEIKAFAEKFRLHPRYVNNIKLGWKAEWRGK